MLGRTLLMVLLALTFCSTWVVLGVTFITALEGEPFYLKYCPFSSHTNETTTIKWYKSNFPEDIALSSNSSPRIVPRGYVLEFWPVELDDNGNYSVHTGYSKYKWQLKVIGRNKSSCFTEKIVKSKAVEVNKRLEVNCEPGYYKNLAYRTVVYKEKNQKDITVMEVLKTYGEVVWKDLGKEEATYDFLETFDCMKIKDSEDSHIKKNANFTDQGYYTCVFSVDHNGKLFNVSKTFNITIIGGHSLISPALHGPNPEYVKVELGQEVRLNCSASLNKGDLIHWDVQDNNTREEQASKIQDKEGKWQASKILIIENINDKNLNVSYNCTVLSTEGIDTKMFILLKKELVDIPGHVFTGGMIAAVLASVAVVCLVIVGVIYRVDLVLFCRHFMRKDETLTDGKTYDAFVSYLKECQPENGEEHTFAVEILPRVLEKHFGYKLCIFERDVLPGRAVVDEVHSLIEKSRRLIIVLSKSYMSNKVRYELESGLHEALVERKIKIILIKFASVSDFTFLPESLKLLKSHRVLKWKADQSLSYNSRFWKNLLYLMPAKEVKACKDESEFLPVLSQS